MQTKLSTLYMPDLTCFCVRLWLAAWLVGIIDVCRFLSSLKTFEERTVFTACLEQLQELTMFLFHNHVVIGSKIWLSLWYPGVLSFPACNA